MNKEAYEKLIKDKTILKGKIDRLTTIDNSESEKGIRAVNVIPEDKKMDNIIIPVNELFLPKSIRSLKIMIGTDISFRLKEVRKEKKKNIVIGERISVLKEERAAFVEAAEKTPDKEYDAVVRKVLDHGAFLLIGNVDVFMYNSAFAEGYIPINAVKKPGDTIRVQFNKYNSIVDIVYVKMKERYKEDMTMKIDELKPQDIMKGTVRTKTSNLCFVNVAPMIDVLCSPIEGIEVGDEAVVKITGFKNNENGRPMVRGKILITKFTDDFRL